MPLLGDLVVADVAVVAPDALVAAEQKAWSPAPVRMITPTVSSSRAPVEGVGQLEERLGPEGVAHLGPVDGDLGDPLGRLVADVAVVARARPSRWARSGRRRSQAWAWRRQHPTPVPSRAVPELVALAVPGGPSFVDELQRVWDDGDAVFPLDPRLPAAGPRAAARRDGPGAPSSTPTASGRAPRRRPAGRGRRRPRGGHQRQRPASPKGVVLTHDAVARLGPRHQPRLGGHRRRPLAGLPARSPTSAACRSSPGPCVTGTAAHGAAGLRRRRGRGWPPAGRHARLARAHRAGPHRPRAVPHDRGRWRRAAGRAAAERRDDLRHDRDRQRRRLRRRAARRRRGPHRRRRRSTCGARCCCAATATAPTHGRGRLARHRRRRQLGGRRPARRARPARRPHHHRRRERVARAGRGRARPAPRRGRGGGRRAVATPSGASGSWPSSCRRPRHRAADARRPPRPGARGAAAVLRAAPARARVDQLPRTALGKVQRAPGGDRAARDGRGAGERATTIAAEPGRAAAAKPRLTSALLAAVDGEHRSRTSATASTSPRSRCWPPPSPATLGWSPAWPCAFTLPWLLFALPAGAIVDRLDRRQVMYRVNLRPGRARRP